MKHTIHTATGQYEFVESELEGTVLLGDALILHQELVKAVKGGADAVGMDTKEFNRVLDELLTTKAIAGDPGMVETMNIEQQTIIQAIKRSFKRTN